MGIQRLSEATLNAGDGCSFVGSFRSTIWRHLHDVHKWINNLRSPHVYVVWHFDGRVLAVSLIFFLWVVEERMAQVTVAQEAAVRFWNRLTHTWKQEP